MIVRVAVVLLVAGLVTSLFMSCDTGPPPGHPPPNEADVLANFDQLLARMAERHSGQPPEAWPQEAQRVWQDTQSARARLLEEHPKLADSASPHPKQTP